MKTIIMTISAQKFYEFQSQNSPECTIFHANHKNFLGGDTPETPSVPRPSASPRPCGAHYGPQKKFTFKSCPHTLLTLYTALYKEHKCILHMTCNKSIFYRCLLNGFNTMVELIRNGNMFEIYGNIFEIYGNTFENHGMKF